MRRGMLILVLVLSSAGVVRGQQKVSATVPAGGIPNGAVVPLGNTTDAKCTATDGTAEGVICLLKQLIFQLANSLTVTQTTAGNLVTTVGAVTAPANANQVAANADSVACATDTGCAVKSKDAYGATLPANGYAAGYRDPGTGFMTYGQVDGGHALTVNPWTGGAFASGAVTTAMTATTSTSVIAGLASNYLYVTQCTASNASTTVSTDMVLQDGSGGTTLYVLPVPAAGVAGTGGGGGTYTFPAPLKVPTAGNGLFAANVTTGSSTKISCTGWRSVTSY